MAKLFDKYYKQCIPADIFEKQREEADVDQRDYVSISAVEKMKKHYIPIKTINEFFNELFKTKIESNRLETDPNLLFNIQNCYNLIYVDVDYYYDLDDEEDVDDAINFNTTMAQIITSALSHHFTNCHYLTFVPSKLTENDRLVKGGIHVYIFTEEPFNEITNKPTTVLNALNSNNDYKDYFNKYQSKLMNSSNNTHNLLTFVDQQPLKLAGGGMPFAQKNKDSRRYKLIEHNINTRVKTEFIKRSELIREISYAKVYDAESDSLKYEEMSKLDRKAMRKMILIEAGDELYEDFNIEGQERSTLKKIEAFLYDFIDGMASMDPNHYFLKTVFQDWGNRRQFELKFIKFYYALMVIGIGSKFPDDIEYMSRRIAQLFSPLYIACNKFHSDEKTQTIEWCLTDTNLPKIIKYYKTYGDMYKQELIEKNKKNNDEDIDEDEKNRRLQGIFQVQDNIKQSILKWSVFVIKRILGNLRYEIQPFSRLNRNRFNNQHTFKDVMPISNQCGLEYSDCNIPKSEYIAQIRNLNKMFIFCLVVDKSVNQITNIVGDIIRAYTKAYVLSKQDDNSDYNKDSIYIYNIHQTEELHKYPYNQWILDSEHNLQNWTFVLYKNMFEPLLNTSAAEKIGGLGLPLKLLEMTKIIDKIGPGKLITKLKSPFEYNTFSKTLVNNILGTYKSELHENPKPEDPEESQYFALRNGILEWKQEGAKYVPSFSTNNRKIILGAYTLINWNDPKTYNKNRREYRDMMQIINQIYPIEDEREYILDLFSTVICPLIRKDQILVAYGTGGDGKSTMNYILTAMLGVSSSMNTMCYENGGKVLLTVPSGYASNINVSTFTHAKRDGNGHDEGGKVNMAHKTFCVCQEPDQDKILITSVIKDLTSGAISHGRKINKAETMFKNNALIVMESNRVLQYDTVDDAVKRRMIVYQHKSKFTTEVNDKQLSNVQFKFSANQELINRAKTHTEYWDALFQILLEHATKLLNKGVRVLSDIKKPKTVEQFTQYSFENSSPLLRYLYDNYEENSDSYIFVTDLIQQIKEYNKELNNRGEDPLVNDKKGIQNKILQELQNKYSGKFYKIKPDIVSNRTFRRKFDKETEDKNINEIIKNYTTGNALTDILNNNQYQHKDIILVGYKFKSNDIDED